MHRNDSRKRSGTLGPIDNRFQGNVPAVEFDRLWTAGPSRLAG
jgi:hypothetical protein